MVSKIDQVLEATVNIYLLQGTHYWVDSDQTDTSNHGIDFKNLNAFKLRAFERTSATVTLSPLFCDDTYTDTSKCVSSDSKITIKLKSDLIFLFVTKSFTMQNIILDASDLVVYSSTTCKTSKQDCCQQDPTTLLYSATAAGTAAGADCTMNNGVPTTTANRYLSPTYNDSSYQTSYLLNKPNGFFNFQFLSDYTEAAVPTLNILDCEIRNFFYHKYASSFISLDRFGGKVNIQNTIFDNFMLPYGLISNGFTAQDRDLSNQTSYSGTHCKILNPSANYDYCHSITIQNCAFSNYNKQHFLLTEVNGLPEILNEGMVLYLTDVFGPILVQNNTFQNMVSILTLPTTGTSYQCADIYATGKGTTPNGLGAMRGSSPYKVDIDRHIDAYIESSINSTGSVFNIRNVTQGLTFYNNTFDSIIGMTGSALYLAGFNNTLSMPIIIQGNNFTNNFAYIFGLTLVIWYQHKNFPGSTCHGILLRENQFINNFGCPGTYGNVILSCMNWPRRASGINSPSFHEASYYGKLSAGALRLEGLGNGIFFLLYKYEWGNYTSGLTSFNVNNPIDGTTINAYQISVIDNTFVSNFATISNSLAVIGAKDLYISGNLMSDSSTPILENYQQDTFKTNAFYTLLGGTTPNIPLENPYRFTRENSPLLLKAIWRVHVINTTFSNNYAAGGIDFYMGSAITIDRHLASTDIIIFNCTFQNYQGFPSSMVDPTQNLYAYNTYPMISVNFGSAPFDSNSYLWVGPGAYGSPNPNGNTVTNINITSCTFQNITFQLTTDNSYYIADSMYPEKINWFLNYYMDNTRNQASILSNLARMSGTAYNSFYVDAGAIFNQVNLVNITDNNGTCWFHPLLYKNYQISKLTFQNIALTVSKNSFTGNPASIICYAEVNIFEGYTSNRNLQVSGFSGSNLTGSLLYIYNRYQNLGHEPMKFSDLAVHGFFTSSAPLVTLQNFDIAVTINGLTIDTGSTTNGVLHISNLKNIALSNLNFKDIQTTNSVVQIFDSQLPHISSMKFRGISHDSSIMTTVTSQDTLTPSTMYAIVNISSSTVGIYDLVVMDTSTINFFYAFTSTVQFKGGLVHNVSGTFDFMGTRGCELHVASIYFNQIDCTVSTCLSGIFSTFSDTLNIGGSVVYNSTILDAMLFSSSLSSITLNSLVITSNTAKKSGSVYSSLVGGVTINNGIFSHNNAEGYGAIVSVRTALTITNSLFYQNAAANQTKNIYGRSGAITINNSKFINYAENSSTTTDFILSQDGPITALNSLFSGGIGYAGAIHWTADVAVANFTNCIFEDNQGYRKGGAIYHNGNLYATNTLFRNNSALVNGSHIYAEKYSSVILTNVSFDSSASTKAGEISIYLVNVNNLTVDSSSLNGYGKTQAIYCETCTTVNLVRSDFTNFIGSTCGSALQIYHPSSLVTSSTYSTTTIAITHTTFNSNKASSTPSKGGAVCIHTEDPMILYQGTIHNSTFTKNTATSQGGAIYYKCTARDCDVKITSSTFIDNSATDQGGAFSFDIQPLYFTKGDLTFSGNTAFYGPDYAAYAVVLSLLPANADSSSSDRRVLVDTSGYDFVSGQYITPALQFELLDEYGQVYTPDSSSTLTASLSNSSAQFLSQRSARAVAGKYSLNLMLETDINADFDLTFSTDGIKSYNRTLSTAPSISFVAHFRDCRRGEKVSDDQRQCLACSANTYSLAKGHNTTCTNCQANLNCYGGDLVGPEPGYWRFDSWTQTPQECPGDGCVGYNRPIDADWEGWCKEQYNETFCYTGWCNYSAGTWGNLCSECRPGWAQQALTGNCIDCAENALNYVYTIGYLLVAVGVILFIIREATKEKDEEELGEDKDERLDTILLRIFTNYLQMISIISSFNMDWPSQLNTAFQQFNQISTAASQIFSFDCFLQGAVFNKFSIKPFFLKVVVTSIVPILIAIVSILAWITLYILRFKFEGTERRLRKLKNKIITTIIVLLFMIHSDVVYVSIQALRCTNIGDEESLAYSVDQTNEKMYLAEDYSIECWTDEHKAFAYGFALPSFIFWGKFGTHELFDKMRISN